MSQGTWGAGTIPAPRHPASVIDADQVLRAVGAPRHAGEVEVRDRRGRARLGGRAGTEGGGDQVKDGRARGLAHLAVDLGEGELHGAPREAGAKGRGEFGRVRVRHYRFLAPLGR